MKLFFNALAIAFFLMACNSDETKTATKPELSSGVWRGIFTNDYEKNIPFNFEITGDTMLIVTPMINGKNDSIFVDEWEVKGDTAYTFFIPVFDARIDAVLQNDGSLAGTYKNFSNGGERVLSFKATPNTAYRFSKAPETTRTVEGRWETTITHNGKDKTMIGVFAQEGAQVTGTFLSKTGDYRYLAGELNRDVLQLSAFDGEHIFLFEATLNANDNLVDGHYYSGKGRHDTWVAIRNEAAELPDPESLTFLKNPEETFNFSFPDLAGNMVSLTDKRFQNKVVLVQILGSWCPNCMDETQFLAPYYRRAKSEGRAFEIIGLAFERTDNDREVAVKRVNRLKERFAIEYPILIASLTTDKDEAAEKLPQLNAIISYPTTIYVDKSGEVRKIHTGFSGPATGRPYQEFVADFEATIEKLLKE